VIDKHLQAEDRPQETAAPLPPLRPQGTQKRARLQCTCRRCLMIDKRGRSPRTMDTIVMVMFGSFLCSVTALSFMELRKIRKKLESK
jgi:hypothetical protein